MRSDDVLKEQFRQTKYSIGYDQQEVDSFLDRVVDTLRSYEAGDNPENLLTAKNVQTVQFASTRYREGYDPQEVDHLLDRLTVAFEALERDN
ncbi:DivIVA domain-containing protein [Gulosibacter macacae]|uniref:Cell wall synthesis protein Wag31 n=1 Tax=Gulosibacter macacae TaxID=2488791 RepID=A0A3P3W358_9MICO|nr:DivIVA domain-containing protein [Gulosibacter macacae]RRJ88857.1 DivIVA domain-containing protein [Gulosibacter macacae]